MSTPIVAPTAAMLTVPTDAWIREPTHTASSGPPVHRLMLTRVVAAPNSVRQARFRKPFGRSGSCRPAARCSGAGRDTGRGRSVSLDPAIGSRLPVSRGLLTGLRGGIVLGDCAQYLEHSAGGRRGAHSLRGGGDHL